MFHSIGRYLDVNSCQETIRLAGTNNTKFYTSKVWMHMLLKRCAGDKCQ
jgi:hypothetical protein